MLASGENNHSGIKSADPMVMGRQSSLLSSAMNALAFIFSQIFFQEYTDAFHRYPPLPADLDGREFPALDHFADLLAGGPEQLRGFLDGQHLDHAHGSSSLAVWLMRSRFS